MSDNFSGRLSRAVGVVATVATMTAALWGLDAIAVPARAESSPENIGHQIAILKESRERWIEIDVERQRLIAWEGDEPVREMVVSTGKPSTPTPPGAFQIHDKRRSDRMTGPGYDIPDVPYAMYYHRGYAIHGAYWHDRFGTPVSHGCTNLRVDQARWLYDWASVGTPVVARR